MMWPELPPDVLREISGRLRDPADLAHFHAVCKPWRDSRELTRTTRKQWVLPWLLAPDEMKPLSISLKLRCVFSRTSYGVVPPFSAHWMDLVASADGTAVSYLADGPNPSLRDPLTGAVTLLLSPFPQENSWWEGSPSGVVYSDGAVLVHSNSEHGDTSKFRAALLRPGDTAWTVIERTFRTPELFEDVYAVYHRGKILITVVGPALTPDDEAGLGDVVAISRPWMPCEEDDYLYEHNYVLESRGELLCVSVYLSQDYPHAFGGKPSVPGLVRALYMSVHVLEAAEKSGKMRWVRKDGATLAGRVLFLGWPNSFAVDASRLSDDDAVSGGCAYFVYHEVGVMPDRPCCVFRYNLVDEKAKFVERLPQGWTNDMCMWLFLQPSIAPTQEIIDRLEGRKWWKKKKKKPHVDPTPRSDIYIERPQPPCYNTYFRVSVRNLPPKVDSFQLRQFFSKYGEVSNAKVVCKKKNKMSKKKGLVTIAMVEERTDALAALNGLIFNRCILEVSLVRRWKGPLAPSARPNMRSLCPLICMALLLLFVIGYLYFFRLHLWKTMSPSLSSGMSNFFDGYI